LFFNDNHRKKSFDLLNIWSILLILNRLYYLGGAAKRSKLFFSLWMWHHAGRPTTDHCAETIGINCYSPRETDDFTQTLDKYEIKAWISPKNELDSLISINEFSKTDQCLRGFLSVDFYDFGMVRTLTRRRIRFW